MSNLIPAQPAEISVGNIVYSRTNPDVVAFNVVEFDDQGSPVFDVFLANFETGDLGGLDLPSVTDNQGSQILLDGERPSFAPDDAFMVFGSAATTSLWFYDFNAATPDQALLNIGFQIAPFNPHWFIFKGDIGDIVATGTEDEGELPSGTNLYSNYPNPFAASTTIRFELDEAAPVSLEMFDALGRSVGRIVDEWLPGRITRESLPGARSPTRNVHRSIGCR